MKKDNILWGALLIAIGALFLLNRFYNLSFLSMAYLWPIFVITPGLIFEASFFLSGKNPGVLVPGGILTTIGLLFWFEILTKWTFSAYTWPIYPLGVAIGLFQLYIFGGRERGVLIASSIVGGVAIVFLLSLIFGKLLSGLLLPIGLILLGIFIVLKGFRR